MDFLNIAEPVKAEPVKPEPQKTCTMLACLVAARLTCLEKGNEFARNHEISIGRIMDTAPHGSGIDNGISIDYDKSTGEKLVFNTSFHHMNDNGYYDGWTEHVITVTPSLQFGFNLKISGRDRNDIKDYLGEVFQSWLDESCSVTWE